MAYDSLGDPFGFCSQLAKAKAVTLIAATMIWMRLMSN